jgi:phage terminase small subunit
MYLLNAQQEQFAAAVAQGKSHREAAILAGYSLKSATCLGSQLAKRANVAERIVELREQRLRALRTRETILGQLNLAKHELQTITICDAEGAPVGFFVPFATAVQNIVEA